MSDRTLLVVAGEFPPLKTIGRIRTVKFVQHLRQHGWRCVVIAPDATGLEPNFDSALQNEIPEGTEVIRLALPDPERRVADLAKRLLGRAPRSTTPAPLQQNVLAHATPLGPDRSKWALQRIADRAHTALRHILKHYIQIPDNYLPWATAAARAAEQICSSRSIDAIYTTLPPFSSAIAGHRIKRATNLPWIVDYRDLWYGDVLREWVPKWRQQMELRIERRLLRDADVVITVSEPKTSFMQRLHPHSGTRWETLTNGYDLDIYAERTRTRPFDSNTIEFVFTGRLFKNRRGYAFAQALGRIYQDRPELVAPVRVRILGGVSPEIRQRYDEILAHYGISKHFDFPGDVPYRVAMDAQVNCDYLLLIVDTGETSDGVIPGKLFEYVAARRPIFALCDPGATQRIIDRARLGIVVPAEDTAGCEAALRQILARLIPIDLDRDEDYIAQFDRRVITAKFARVLDETVAPKNAAAAARSVHA